MSASWSASFDAAALALAVAGSVGVAGSLALTVALLPALGVAGSLALAVALPLALGAGGPSALGAPAGFVSASWSASFDAAALALGVAGSLGFAGSVAFAVALLLALGVAGSLAFALGAGATSSDALTPSERDFCAVFDAGGLFADAFAEAFCAALDSLAENVANVGDFPCRP